MGIILILFILMLIVFWVIVTRSMSFKKKAVILVVIPIIAGLNAIFSEDIVRILFGCENVTAMDAEGNAIGNCSTSGNVYGWGSLFSFGAILPWTILTAIFFIAETFKNMFR